MTVMSLPATVPSRSTEDALRGAVEYLVERQRPDGGVEGHMDGGVLFNASQIVLARAARALRPPGNAEDSRELELARYLLREQLPTGLFRAFPDGPASHEATRAALLALNRVLDENDAAGPQVALTRRALENARVRARAAVAAIPAREREPLFLRGFRQVLDVVDRAASAPDALIPDLRALLLPSTLFARPALALRAQLDGRLFPFISVLLPMLMLLARELRGTSLLLRASPFGFWTRPTEELVEFLLDHVDGTGGFFYSGQYTQLLITTLTAVRRHRLPPALCARIDAAVERGEAYIKTQEVQTPDGLALRLLGSDLWDSVSVAYASLAGGGAPTLPPRTFQRFVRFVLDCQTSDGGWAFGRLGRFTDCDTTGWACGLLARTYQRTLLPELHERMAKAICGGVDLLSDRVSPSGGIGAWGRTRVSKQRGTVSEIDSILFDLPTEEVTSRTLYILADIRDLYEADGSFRAVFGAERRRRVSELVEGAIDFLRAQRDPLTGLWPARWEAGYFPGTAFALLGLDRHAFPELAGWKREAVATVLKCPNEDGGFGESIETDLLDQFQPAPPSAVLHTASALQILDCCGAGREHPVYRAGLRYILSRQNADGSFSDRSLYTCFSGYYYRYNIMTHGMVLALLSSS